MNKKSIIKDLKRWLDDLKKSNIKVVSVSQLSGATKDRYFLVSTKEDFKVMSMERINNLLKTKRSEKENAK